MSKKYQPGTHQFGMVCAGIGVAAGLLLVLFGFWKALLVCLLGAIGYFIGAVPNKTETTRNWVNKHFPPKTEQKPIEPVQPETSKQVSAAEEPVKEELPKEE